MPIVVDVPRAINRCPRCHEPVSPFAAGCAICGEDLEAARARLASRKSTGMKLATRSGTRLDRPQWLHSGSRIDWMNVAVALILAVAVSPIGLLLALYWAYQRQTHGETGMMFIMLVIAALAAAALIAPGWFWSHLYGGL